MWILARGDISDLTLTDALIVLAILLVLLALWRSGIGHIGRGDEYEHEFAADGAPPDVLRRIALEIAPALRRTGYKLKDEPGETVTLRRHYVPMDYETDTFWGQLKEGFKPWRAEQITFAVAPLDGGDSTTITVTGRATTRLAKRLRKLLDPAPRIYGSPSATATLLDEEPLLEGPDAVPSLPPPTKRTAAPFSYPSEPSAPGSASSGARRDDR